MIVLLCSFEISLLYENLIYYVCLSVKQFIFAIHDHVQQPTAPPSLWTKVCFMIWLYLLLWCFFTLYYLIVSVY